MKYRINKMALLLACGFTISACQTTQAPEASEAKAPTAIAGKTASSTNAAPVAKAVIEPPLTSAAANSSAAKPPETVAIPVVKPEQLLNEGRELYDKGDYRGAIRKLTSARDASDETPAVKQTSLKYLAFSFCVTNQRPLCKTQFVSLLKMQPTFELSRGEAGHPLWGPVFKEAKAGTQKPSK